MKHRIIGTAVSLFLLSITVVPAQQTKSPSTFTYNLRMGGAGGGGQTITMAFAIKSSAGDGTRNGTVTVKAPQMPPLNGKQMDATISRYGEIRFASSGDMPAKFSIANVQAANQAMMSPMLQQMVDPIDTFAAGIGSAPSLKTGTSWHAPWQQGQTDLTFSVTGRQQVAGHDAVMVTMSSPSSASMSLTGQGAYDPMAHLIVTLHCETKPSGAKMGQTVDVNLTTP